MKLAIDIDGTITRFPQLFLSFLQQYPEAVILTGYAGEDWQNRSQADLVSGRREQLRPLIGDAMNEVVVCVGRTVNEVAIGKAMYCLNNLIDAIFDDAEIYCRAVRRFSPRTAVFKVME